jgi:hypothetical protein
MRGMVPLGGRAALENVVVKVDVVMVVVNEDRPLHREGHRVIVRGVWDAGLRILRPLVRVTLVIDFGGASLDREGMVPSWRPERRVLVPASNRQSHRTCSVLSAAWWTMKGLVQDLR